MKKNIIGILVCTLLIANVCCVFGISEEKVNPNENRFSNICFKPEQYSNIDMKKPVSTDINSDYIVYWNWPETDIYRMNPDGSGNTLIKENGIQPSYSPDNSKIAYAFPDSDGGIWVMNSDGTNPIQLNTFGWAPSWSPDMSKIVYHIEIVTLTSAIRYIWIMNADGTGAHLLTNNPGEFPDWSPKGDKIAYSGFSYSTKGIWLINPDGTGETHLYTDGGYPSWSQEGDQISYRSYIGYGEIWVMNSDGTGQRRLTSIAGVNSSCVSSTWSPDDEQIAYSHHLAIPAHDIRVINNNGTNDNLICSNATDPDWSNNIPPTKPIGPFGPTFGIKGQNLTYTYSSTDANGDRIRYGCDFLKDDFIVDLWTDHYYPSGDVVTHYLKFNIEGRYTFRVIAEDEHGAQSLWSDHLDILILKSREKTLNSQVLRLIENYLLLYQLLQRL